MTLRVAGLALVAAFAFAPPAPAAPPGTSGGPGAPPPVPRRDPGALPQQGQPAGLQVGGHVLDQGGSPLPGVVVKMFANGSIINSTTSNPDGGFEIEGNPQLGGNNTAVLWFQVPGSELLPSSVILSLGSVAAERHLYSDCTPRIQFLGNAARVEVTMMTLAQRNRAVQTSGCLGAASAP